MFLRLTVCPSGSFPVAYTYDLAGDTTSASNGMGVMISYAYDAAARPTIVTSSLVDAQHPATLATVDSTLGYYPHGALRKMTPGNGLTQTAAFNNALQPCRMNVNSSGAALGACADAIPSGNVQDFNYAFNAGTSDNGNVMSWTATGQQAFSRSFAYDSLNRLATMQETSGNAEGCKPGSSPTNPYTLSWTIDPWGNRTNQTPSAGTCSFSQTVNSQNQLVGPPYQYDAAGNMTNDGNHAYFYDAENRLVQVDGGNTAIYVYDAYGHRVRSTVSGTSRDYVYNSDSVVAEWYSSCNCWGMGYVYANGSPLAQYANSTTYFAHKDHLGSTRLLTGMDHSIYDNMDYLPFGEQIAGGSGTTHKFTGDERDAETGLDHTWFRQYSSQLGRWMHPDPAGLAAVDLANPQSWNRYAYVGNNPMNYVDPLGLTDCPQGKTCGDPWNQDPSWADWSGLFGRDLFGGGWFFGPGNPGNGCPPWDASCDTNGGGIGIGISIGLGGGGGGGPTRNPAPPVGTASPTPPGLPQTFLGIDDTLEIGICVLQPELCVLVGAVVIGTAATVVLNDLARRLVKVAASCQVVDFANGENVLGYVTGVGVGVDFQSAYRTAKRVAGANAVAQYWRPGRQIRVRHCQAI